MALTAGTSLGPYQIDAPLGAGGMGEVYKATDTRLDRTVAIKVLPEHVANDPDLKQRFEREARTVAALNHPHICTLYDIGTQDGIDFLVMEYLDGQTLAQRLEKGALPLDQALQVAVQIADALDKAHRQGIVHRDLKPANIMLTKSGAKLLDFGLAKLKPADQVGGLSAMATQSAGLTQEGAILGTFQYMAPEQVEGQEADARTDIFAFGAVVYEMMTGKRAFDGKSQASLIGAILKDQPAPISSVQVLTPAALDQIVETCLAKDSDDRWQSAADLARQLKQVARSTTQTAAAQASGAEVRGLRGVATAGVAVTAAVLATVLTWTVTAPEPAGDRPQRRFEIGLGFLDAMPLAFSRAQLALSPDGTRLTFVAIDEDGIQRLHLRALDQTETRVLEGTEMAHAPFFSPDGQWIGYFDPLNRTLKKISVLGGAPMVLSEAQGHYGATWLENGSIVFSGWPASSLLRIPESGGTPQVMMEGGPGERDTGNSLWPQAVGERAILFTSYSRAAALNTGRIVVRSLETGEQRILFDPGYYARYLPSGHLVFARDGALWAVSFDAETLQTVGQEAVVLRGLEMSANDAPAFAYSDDGLMMYLPGYALAEGRGRLARRTLVWVDHTGEEEPLPLPVGHYESPRLSPDGRRVAVAVFNGEEWHLWVYDVETGAALRLVQDGGARGMSPTWTPDGARIIFHSTDNPAGVPGDLYSIPSDGSGSAQRLTEVEGVGDYPSSVSPDGPTVIFTRILDPGPNVQREINALPLDGSGEARMVLEGNSSLTSASMSPDGRWLAYQSNESGQSEVYLQPYPGPGPKTPVSIGGGVKPAWAADGRTLYYRGGAAVMAVDVESSPALKVERPRQILEDNPYYRSRGVGRQYDVAPDGRLLMVRRGTEEGVPSQASFVVVENWFDELQRLVPIP